MRRAFLTAMAGIAWAALVAGRGTPAAGIPGHPVDLQPVQDADSRFVISVPPTWRVVQSRKDPAFSAKSPEPPGTSPDTVEVFVRDMLYPLSPERCGWQVAWVMRMTIHEWTTLSEGPDSVGGLAAFSRTYTWHLNTGEERRSVQTCVPLGRRMFVVIGTTMNTPNRVAQMLPELTRMISTFRPGPAPVPPPLDPRAPNDR